MKYTVLRIRKLFSVNNNQRITVVERKEINLEGGKVGEEGEGSES